VNAPVFVRVFITAVPSSSAATIWFLNDRPRDIATMVICVTRKAHIKLSFNFKKILCAVDLNEYFDSTFELTGVLYEVKKENNALREDCVSLCPSVN
jgi:hypothetical protein